MYRVQRIFSKIQDQDYYDDAKARKDEATKGRKAAPWAGAAIGGIVGAGIGGPKHWKAGGAIGAAGLGYAFHRMGKSNEEKVHKEENRNIERYKNSSEKDKAYLRHRAEKLKEERLRQEQIRATRDAGMMAGRW